MNKVRYISALCLLLCSIAASAQTYEKVLSDNFWNASYNVAGVRQDTISRSYAELYGEYFGGGFRDTWEAAEGWRAGAETASIRHLKKISLTGSFSFEQKEGYGMCGSMFIEPGFYPIDVMEFTPGRKTLQTYAFDGGISYDVRPNWRIGAKMDFESANMSKRKDLRHTNWRLDMSIAPGFMYHRDSWAFGAAAIFRKTSESVDAEQVGIAETSYFAFLDKGMMYGAYGVWTGSGLHLNESGVNGLPVKDFTGGVAAQMQHKGLFVEAAYLRSQGTVGEKEYIWFSFPGNEVTVDAGWKISPEHRLRVNMGWKGIEMDESVLEKVTANGVTTVQNHGSNTILTQGSWHVSPEYEHLRTDIGMEFRGGLDWNMQKSMTTQVYPYIYSQTLTDLSAYAGFMFRIRKFEYGVKGRYMQGWVAEDGRLAETASGVQTEPFRLQEWYDRQMEYRTAARFCAGIMVRYRFLKGIYIEAEGKTVKAFGLKYIDGRDRLIMTLKIGYEF